MTRVRTDARTGHVRNAFCPCGSPLLALPGGTVYVCERARCTAPAMTAQRLFLAINGRPANQIVPARQGAAVG